jgi:hypothetical protein
MRMHCLVLIINVINYLRLLNCYFETTDTRKHPYRMEGVVDDSSRATYLLTKQTIL